MTTVPNGVETLPKISTGWVGRKNVTDDRQTDRRETDGRQHIATVNVSSRSLKSNVLWREWAQNWLGNYRIPLRKVHQSAFFHTRYLKKFPQIPPPLKRGTPLARLYPLGADGVSTPRDTFGVSVSAPLCRLRCCFFLIRPLTRKTYIKQECAAARPVTVVYYANELFLIWVSFIFWQTKNESYMYWISLNKNSNVAAI